MAASPVWQVCAEEHFKSDNGGVTRGICKMDEDYNLTEVVETKNIVRPLTGAEAEGMAVDVDSLVSMNMLDCLNKLTKRNKYVRIQSFSIGVY
ncbi:MAG: hypothetical protein ACLVHS_08890 [Blautia wexlerae]